MKRAGLFVLILALLAPVAFVLAASSGSALYNRGNDLYEDNRFEEAADAYNQAVEHGARGPDLYYNLGNAELRSGNLGRAIAAYLKAKALAPRDPDISFNLHYARERIKSRPPAPDAGPFTRAFNAVTGRLSASEWALMCMVFYWSAAGFGVLFIVLSPSGGARKASKYGLYVFVLLLAASLPFAAARVKRDILTPRAVVMDDSVTARSGPGDDNAALFELHEGVDVVVGQCEQGWCRVSASGGFIGWVPGDSFERI